MSSQAAVYKQYLMAPGIVYILTNAAMPDHVKIGYTTQDDLNIRVKQLDNTSVPVPFEVFYAAKVADYRKLESTLHFVFGENRARKNREFFSIDPDLAKAIIGLVEIEPITLSDEEQAIDAGEREEIEKLRARRGQRNFKSLGIPVGAVLNFVKDSDVTCIVASEREVEFEGTLMSLSAAAMQAVTAMGYNWTAIQGPAYWTYRGTKISELGQDSESHISTDQDANLENWSN